MGGNEQCEVDGCGKDAVAVFEGIGLRREVSRVTACDEHAPKRGGVHRPLDTAADQEDINGS